MIAMGKNTNRHGSRQLARRYDCSERYEERIEKVREINSQPIGGVHNVVPAVRLTADAYIAHGEHKWWKTSEPDSSASHGKPANTRDNRTRDSILARNTR
ncbi:hypothetical protein [Dictyobacter vulcani]|nr:hypothetical protein [Dictyobacter vulcani]